MALFYTDASALVKLVHEEPETAPLHAFLGDADLVSSELVLTEVQRAIRRAAAHDPDLPLRPLIERGHDLLDAVALLPLDRALLVAAGAFSEPALRALDANQVAAAVHPLPSTRSSATTNARAPPPASPIYGRSRQALATDSASAVAPRRAVSSLAYRAESGVAGSERPRPATAGRQEAA